MTTDTLMLDGYQFETIPVRDPHQAGTCPACGAAVRLGGYGVVIVDRDEGTPVTDTLACRRACAEKWLAGELHRRWQEQAS